MSAINLKIDMISLCNADGSLRPLRFRYEDTERRIRRVTVTEVLCCKAVQYVGIEAFVYTCRATEDITERLLELKYTIQSHSWTLVRFLY